VAQAVTQKEFSATTSLTTAASKTFSRLDALSVTYIH